MKKLLSLLLVLLFCASVALTGCGQQKPESKSEPTKAAEKVPAKTVKIVAAHNQTSPDNPYQVGLLKFKEVAEKASNGTLQVEVHAGTLGTDEAELVQKLKLGAADVVIASPGFMTQTGIKQVDIFALPYLFDSYTHWQKVVDGEIGQQMAKMINEKSNNDFKIIGYWSAGVRHYYGKKPLQSMADLKGIKIRTQTSGVVAEYWTKAGAIPTSVAWGELYQALQQKTVDASENAYPFFVQQNHHKTENGKYITETGHDFTTRFMLVNGKKFDSLSKEQQQALLDAAKASVDTERKSVADQDKEYKDKAIAEGAKVNEIDRKPFIELAVPLIDKAAKNIGAEDMIKKVRELK